MRESLQPLPQLNHYQTIYDLDGFTDYLHRTGEQDAEIDEWLTEHANAA
jgi:hypothetical protein